MFIPSAAHLSEPFSLNNILTINMRTADRIKHVIGFIVRRAVQPIFPHRNIGILIMRHSVADHRRCDAFGRKLTTVLMAEHRNLAKENIIEQFRYCQTDVTEHLFTPFCAHHRDTCVNRQPRHQIITSTRLELCGKITAPILAATFPTVDMEDTQHTLRDIFRQMIVNGTKPMIELLVNGRNTELITFQPLRTTASGIGVSCGSMPNTKNMPTALTKFSR